MIVTTLLLCVCLALVLGACFPSTKGDVIHPEVRKGTVRCGGGVLHYLEAGEAKAPPILLLHGARYSSQTWLGLGVIARMATAGFHVVAVDLPGFGASLDCAASSDGGAYLGEACNALELIRPVLVAPSMSGRFALPYAASSPELIAGLVAVAPVGANGDLSGLEPGGLPMLAIWGGEDAVSPVAIGRNFAGQTRAEFLVLSGASHPCYLDAPVAFGGAVLGFARRVQGL